jgi:hypothetical protein
MTKTLLLVGLLVVLSGIVLVVCGLPDALDEPSRPVSRLNVIVPAPRDRSAFSNLPSHAWSFWRARTGLVAGSEDAPSCARVTLLNREQF